MEHMITEDRWNQMEPGERNTFFLVNVLRLLTTEQQSILAKNVLARLPRDVYEATIKESETIREDKKP